MILSVCPLFKNKVEAADYDYTADLRTGSKELTVEFDSTGKTKIIKALIALGDGSFESFPASTGYSFHNGDGGGEADYFFQCIEIGNKYGGNVTFEFPLSSSKRN